MLIEALRNQVSSLQIEVKEYQDLLKESGVKVPDHIKEKID